MHLRYGCSTADHRRPVPDGATVTQVTRGIIRYASNPKNVTVKTLDNCQYIVQVQDDNVWYWQKAVKRGIMRLRRIYWNVFC
ncbi:hypothetical protein [Chitinophaga pinensis]|uniref:hypothetical protein n=1 Tax=Chitinophaga pinensis TaxID=79329 RepID=UPI0016490698|nr:hypothetical protein [Chitinophaga pinensis]